jgi:hypothetical protein
MKLLLTELQHVPDEKLPGSGSVRLSLLLVKHTRNPRIAAMLRDWLDDAREILRREGADVCVWTGAFRTPYSRR